MMGIRCAALLSLALGGAAVASAAAAPARGPLRVCKENPRYFATPDGHAVYLTGSHTWNTLQDVTGNEWYLPNLLSQKGFAGYLDFLAEHHHNFIRLWTIEHAWDAETGVRIAPHPWLRTGPGNALDGKPRFDLTRFDPAYFQRLRERVIAARDHGIYVSVMLFGGYWSTEHASTWKGNPFNAANNVNGIDGDPNHDGKGNEIYSLQVPQALAVQKATAAKTVETLDDLDNVLYEVANEVRAVSTPWQYEIVKHVRSVEARLPKQHPIGMTGCGPIPNADLLNGPADWISPSPSGGDYCNNPPAATGQKVILTDTDHLWGEGGNRAWVWKSFTRGLNPIWMERVKLGAGDLPDAEAIRRAMGEARLLANRMDLNHARPAGELASSGYCLAEPGKAYVVYAPAGRVRVDLSAVAGEVSVEWLNTASGQTTAGPGIAGGAAREFAAPFAGDAVLYLHAASQRPR